MARFTQAARAALVLTVTLPALPALAQTVFDEPAAFDANIRMRGDGGAVYPGSTVETEGSGFVAGQEVRVLRGTEVLSTLTADAKGNVTWSFDLPEDAALGLHPIVVQTENPDSATVLDLKISPEFDVTEGGYDVVTSQYTNGLYQVDHSEANDTLFTASAVGRPPVTESQLTKLNAETLEVITAITPAEASRGVYAVYGVGVDDAHANVWTTNTRQNTVAVYAQDDLSLVKQFEDGTVDHPRDVVIDEANNRAYVSTSFSGTIAVFDTETLEKLDDLTVESAIRRATFGAMALELDEENGQLYTISRSTPEVARIDLASGEVTVFEAPVDSGTGVTVDPATGTIFVAGARSDNIVAVSADGDVLFDTKVGAYPLNLAYNPVSGNVYAANRESGTLVGIDATSGEVAVVLEGGSFPNHLDVLEDGTIVAVNKARGQDDPTGDTLRRIAPNM
ncbi:MAG: hypothetical protein VX874_06695 [Pseudomonadota bacterium]|nr:hypothetical protein [Pseudomonadota bacterium]